MSQSYKKFILVKGLVMVCRGRGNSAGYWFPEVIFYDNDGEYLFSISGKSRTSLYEALKVMNDTKRGTIDRLFDPFPYWNYSLSLLNGRLHIIPEEYDWKSHKDAIIIMGRANSNELLKAIDEL